MATATMPVTRFVKDVPSASCEVRIWGMDTNNKPFIQNVSAGHFTEKTALLTGVLPVKTGDVVGIRHRDTKARFNVTWISDEDGDQVRSIGVECLEDRNFWGVRTVIPMQQVSTAAMYANANGSTQKAGAPGLPQMPNRREAVRYTCRVAADVAMVDAMGQAYAWVSDISSKGCYLQMISPFAVGAEIVVSMYAVNLAKESPLVLRARTKTCHPMVGMGVEFVDLSDESQAKLQVVIEQLHGGKPAAQDIAFAPIAAPPAPSAPAAPVFSLRPAESQSSVKDFTRMGQDLNALESQLDPGSVDFRLIEEFREAVVHTRRVLSLLQQWTEAKEQGRDPFVVLPALSQERVRAAGVMNRHIALDLDSLQIHHDTVGFQELRRRYVEIAGKLQSEGARH